MEENSKNQELLDPNVCKGSEFLPNILESLGVSTTITRNGAVMNRLQLDFNVFFEQNNMDLRALELHPTEADIEAVRNTIQKKCLMGEKGQRKEYILNGECDICISGDTSIAVRLPKGKEHIDDKTAFGGKKEIHSNLGKSRRYMSSKDGEVVINTDSWSQCSVEMGKSDIRTADPTTSTVMQTWSKEGLLMEETSLYSTAAWSNGKFDIHHINQYKTRLNELPFAYRYEHTNYFESQMFETGNHKHIGYCLADIDRNPSELNGTEEFKSKKDVAEWYELQNKENFWKKLSEKAIAIVNLARNYVQDSIFKTTMRNDIEQYCGDRVVDASTFASMYNDNTNPLESTEILNAIKNTREAKEQGLQQEGQEGEEH